MPYIMNSLSTPVSVQVWGEWFSFKPEQIKYIHNPALAEKMHISYGESGLVGFPEDVFELGQENKTDPKYLAVIQEKKMEGRTKRIAKLEWLKFNEEISLRRDLEQKNIQSSPFTFASPALVGHLKELKALKENAAKESGNLVDEITKLMESIDGSPNKPDAGKTDSGNSSYSKPAKS